MAAEQPRRAASGELLDILRGHVEKGDLSVRGEERHGLINTRFPAAFRYPHDRAHHTSCKANHSATVEVTNASGTVRSPRRVNSAMSVSWSCACTIRRHSSVASDPT